MTDVNDIRADLEQGASEEIVLLGERLQRERPVPAAAFRGDLRRRLLAGRSSHRARPARLRMVMVGWTAGGTLLLLVGAASAAGLGPLAA